MTTEIAKDKAKRFVDSGKQYNSFSVMYGIAEKVFNDGMGSLALYRFGSGLKITANMALETKSDRKRLKKLFPDHVVVEDQLWYPDWYFHTIADPDKPIKKRKSYYSK